MGKLVLGVKCVKKHKRSRKHGSKNKSTATSTVTSDKNLKNNSSSDDDDDDVAGHESLLRLLVLAGSDSSGSSSSAAVQPVDYGYRRLPPELMCRIYSYLPHYDLGQSRLVDRHWDTCAANIEWTRFIIFLHGFRRHDMTANDTRLHTVREETVGSTPYDFIIHRLTFEDIMDKLNSIETSTTRTYQIWIYGNHLNLGQTSCRQLWTLLDTFKHRITHLTLVQRLPDTENTYCRTVLTDLVQLFHLLRKTLEYVEFAGYMPIDVRIPYGTSFPKLRNLKTLSFKRPGFRVEEHLIHQEKNETVIHQIAKNAANLKNIINYPVTVNHGIIKDTLKTSKNVQAVESFYLTSSKRQNILICMKNFVLNNHPKNLKVLEFDDRFEVFNEQSCVNIAYGSLLKSSAKTLEELKIYPLDFSIEPIEFPVMEKLKKLTVSHLHTIRFRLFPSGADVNSLFPNLTTVDLALNMLPFSINSSSILDDYFPPDIFTNNNNDDDEGAEQKPKGFSTVKELIMMKSMPAKCWKKLQQLFPNVQKLELKMESESISLRHCDIMNVIGDIWPGLKELSMRYWKLEELEYLPVSFPKALLSMTELKVLKFRFSPSSNYLPWDNLQGSWMSVLLDYLENEQLSHLRILVLCDWALSSNCIEFIRNFFDTLEPWIQTSY